MVMNGDVILKRAGRFVGALSLSLVAWFCAKMLFLFFFFLFFFFFNDTATTEIYTLSLHDAPSDLLDGLSEV